MGAEGKPSGTKHVKTLGFVIGGALVAALVLKSLFVPKTYGEFGHYRGDAVQELMNVKEPVHQGMAACNECHSEIVDLHDKDVHKNVQCETCHGPGDKHIRSVNAEDGHAKEMIILQKTQDLCLGCHRRLHARPSNFPQVDPAQHFKMLGVDDPKTPCISCHSPHEPLFLDKKLSEARLHPMIELCANCHREPVSETAEVPATHPTVFRCGYCHELTANDAKGRAHDQLGCGTCHQFYVESETAGRVVKHRDARFCLLCHEDRSFVNPPDRPTIKWPQHRSDVAKTPEDAQKTCADCHRDAFHNEFRAGAAHAGAKP